MADEMFRDPELVLALANVPIALRPAVETLFRLDERLGGIVVEPNAPIAAIKLAWWREALERLDGTPPPPEPLLRAIADTLLSRGVTGADLAAIGTGWDALIAGDEDEGAMLALHAEKRGGGLFAAAALLLGGAAGVDVRAAGQCWALVTLPPPFVTAGRALAAECADARVRWPRRLRALGVLRVLAGDRIRHGGGRVGSPRRVARAFWHGISGW